MRKDEDVKPVAYNAIHKYVWEEVLHQVGSKGRLRAVIDLTANDTTLAMVAMETRTPSLGIAFNAFHLEQLRRRLTQLVSQRFLVPQSTFYNPDLALLMSACELTPNPDEAPPPPQKAKLGEANSRESMVNFLIQGAAGDKGPQNREVQVVDDD